MSKPFDSFLPRFPIRAHAVSGDRITKITPFLVAPRWLFVKIETEQGLVGWGEGTLEGRSEVVAAQVQALEPLVLGQDPDNIAFVHKAIATLPFYHTDAVIRSALSGIDIALWDILGKRLGRPIASLLGGIVNARIRCYRWFGGNVPLPSDIPTQKSAAAMLEELLKDRDPEEWSYFKMNACPGMGPVDTEGAIEHAEAVLASLWEKFQKRKVRIGIDCHGRLKPATARQFLRMVERFSPLVWFVEEPVRVEEIQEMPLLRQQTFLRLATGERFYLPSDFHRLCSSQSVDLLQPDLGHCGGISAGRMIADIAEMYQLGFAPHCPNGPILLAASAQVQFYTSACAIQETSVGIHYNGDRDASWYLKKPEAIIPDRQGFLPALNSPGLGIEIDESKVLEASRVGVTWDESSCHLSLATGGAPTDW